MSGNIIDRAIDYIHEHGWTKGGARDRETGAVCAMGAVWGAQGYWESRDAYLARDRHAEAAAFRALKEEIPRVGEWATKDPIAAFNDDPSTTVEDVFLAMKKASARLDEQTS